MKVTNQQPLDTVALYTLVVFYMFSSKCLGPDLRAIALANECHTA